jgi:hypothetical protein
MTRENLGYRHSATSVGNPDLGTYGEIPHSGLNQLFCSRRTIDDDRLRSLAIPRQGHQGTKTCRVIVMMMRNKNRSDLSDINTRFRKAACDTIAGINDIMRPVDG